MRIQGLLLALGVLLACGSVWAEGGAGQCEEDESDVCAQGDTPPECRASDDTEVRVNVFPLVNYRRSGHRKKVKVGNAVVAHGYSHTRHGEHKKVAVLDVPLASLAKARVDGDRTEVRLINAPGFSVLRVKHDEDSSSVKVLKAPLFALIDTKQKSNGQFDRKFLRLPLIGPLFRHKRTADEESVRFLFFKLKHKRKLNKEDAYEEARSRHDHRHSHGRRRANGH